MDKMTGQTAVDLERALAEDKLELWYQPQVTANGAKIAAVEALARWRNSAGVWVSPAMFVAAAEKHGLIDDLGQWVLRRACQDALRWPGLTVSVNVSPLQFRNPAIVRQTIDCIEARGLSLNRIEIEITEGAVFENPKHAQRLMNELREAGVRMALDDFGTGFASLSYLRTLPWDKVKIDKSFVDGVGFMTSAAIVHAIVALARALGLSVTAEGVETAEQQKFLKLAGCQYLQGFLFSRAIPAEELTGLLATWNNAAGLKSA